MEIGSTGYIVAADNDCSLSVGTVTGTKFSVADNVHAFVLQHDLQTEFNRIPRQLEIAFAPESVEIYLLPSYDDQNSICETIVLRIKSNLSRKAFREATVRFIEMNFSESSRLAPSIAVLHDL